MHTNKQEVFKSPVTGIIYNERGQRVLDDPDLLSFTGQSLFLGDFLTTKHTAPV